MRSRIIILTLCLLPIILIFTACGGGDDDGENSGPGEVAFDREAMLQDWADLIIIPGYEAYVASLNDLVAANETFSTDLNETNLENLRTTYIAAYTVWQRVAMFEIGAAEELQLGSFTNIYPASEETILENISTGDYNLEAEPTIDAQGFPALDYMLFGLGSTLDENLAQLSESNNLDYLEDLINRLQSLGSDVLTDWNNGFREEFISNSGASATASVDKLVNDFLFYYERFLRAGKIGIPAGVFSGTALATHVEAPYSGIYSKMFFQVAFASVRDFFEGTSFDGSRNGLSLNDYLETIQGDDQPSTIATALRSQWATAESASQLLSDNLNQQVLTDNAVMLSVYDELQEAVLPLKMDLLQALNIQVDFIDADGD